MGKQLRVYMLIAALGICFLFTFNSSAAAQLELDEMRQLLQKGLNLVELDQELARLSEEEKKIEQDIVETEADIAANQDNVAHTRERAGKVLQAYYMGERTNIWLMILTSESITSAIATFQYIGMLLDSDQLALNNYANAYKHLTQAMENLVDKQQQLHDVKELFLAERERAVALQQEIDEAIAASAHAEALQVEFDRFTQDWRERGIPLFHKYLSSISESMQGLPELLTGENAERYVKQINIRQRSMEFEISDEDLIVFFRSRNALFDNISFRFEDNQFQAYGTEDQVEISITGHYTIENIDVNMLLFHVNELTYNGFILPESSNRALEQEFALGFVPSSYVSGIEATEVSMEDGFMRLKLAMR